ncbi:MAG: hypothetical protein HPY64_12865 [Anaerolineae bacterium]|nr:hypothetical protein [Anaerolineae bacterium]
MMRLLRSGPLAVLLSLILLVILVVVLVDGAFTLLTRPQYVTVDIPLPGGEAWGPAQTARATFNNGTAALDVRWQATTLASGATWEEALTIFRDTLIGQGWAPLAAPPAIDPCPAVLEELGMGGAATTCFGPADHDRPDRQPPLVCLAGEAAGDSLRVALITASAPHANW